MWRELIKKVGMQAVADALGLKYETVRGWCNDGLIPKVSTLKSLVAFMFKNLSSQEFELFINSLSQDIMGIAA
jgi:hypothetical protein